MLYGNYCYIIIENFPQKFSPCTLGATDIPSFYFVHRIIHRLRRFYFISFLSLFFLDFVSYNFYYAEPHVREFSGRAGCMCDQKRLFVFSLVLLFAELVPGKGPRCGVAGSDDGQPNRLLRPNEEGEREKERESEREDDTPQIVSTGSSGSANGCFTISRFSRDFISFSSATTLLSFTQSRAAHNILRITGGQRSMAV